MKTRHHHTLPATARCDVLPAHTDAANHGIVSHPSPFHPVPSERFHHRRNETACPSRGDGSSRVQYPEGTAKTPSDCLSAEAAGHSTQHTPSSRHGTRIHGVGRVGGLSHGPRPALPVYNPCSGRGKPSHEQNHAPARTGADPTAALRLQTLLHPGADHTPHTTLMVHQPKAKHSPITAPQIFSSQGFSLRVNRSGLRCAPARTAARKWQYMRIWWPVVAVQRGSGGSQSPRADACMRLRS